MPTLLAGPGGVPLGLGFNEGLGVLVDESKETTVEDHKLTPWFCGNDKPVRVGVYMLCSGGSVGYQYWNGLRWFAWSTTPNGAVLLKHMPAANCFQNDNWRGLTKKPRNV